MHTLVPFLVALLACTTTQTPEPHASGADAQAEEAAIEDTAGPSVRSPGKLATTLRTQLADDPDAEPQAPEAPPAIPEAGAHPDAAATAQPDTVSTAPTSIAPTQVTLPAPGKKAPAPCDGISSELARAITGDIGGLEVDLEGRVRVTYEFTSAPDALPQGFLHETSAMGHGQGWCPPAQLCALAGLKGISRVRSVRHADPKFD